MTAPLAASGQIAGDSVNMVSGVQWPGGDPFLQRQNEPSIAVSSANPMHLLAGANDYRSVDIPFPFGTTPPPGYMKMAGDAWQGVFKSYDGGQTWKSYLMPGFPQDTSDDGKSSKAQSWDSNGKATYNAAADSVVRAGTDGMFYFAGIVFRRGTNDGRVVLNRFIDLNNKEDGDPLKTAPSDPTKATPTDSIRWIDSSVIDQGGAWFADKPWIAVDVPRAGSVECNIARFGRRFQGGMIYAAWARIYSDTQADIMFSSSRDCGETWSAPLKLNDQKSQASQGASVTVDPRTGYVYVAWRRFGIQGASPQQTDDAIFAVRSFSMGAKFTHPRLVTTFVPFEQAQGDRRFRTEVFPSIVASVDATGTRSWVHVAWSQRAAAGKDGQVVMTHVVVSAPPKSYDEWNDPLDGWKVPPVPIDTAPVLDRPLGTAFSGGHQFMPAVTFSQGRLVVVYYDSRLDHTRTYYTPHVEQSPDPCAPVGTCWVPNGDGRWYDEQRGPLGERTDAAWRTDFLDDSDMAQTRHTIDVRMATATPSANPVFTSATLSRMPFGARGDESALYPGGSARGFDGSSIAILDWKAVTAGTSSTPSLLKLQDLQVNPPNLPMFKNGTTPFIGDYIDVQGPMFVRTATGWAFDTAPNPSPVFHATWTSNQDVVPPLDGNWQRYTPPERAKGTVSVFDPGQTLQSKCEDGFTGTRNQNIYTARISDGLVVASPQNAKKFLDGGSTTRTFVVSAFNATTTARPFLFSFGTLPPGVQVSFRPDRPFPTSLVTIPAHSAAVQTVFMTLDGTVVPSQVNPATLEVKVTEQVDNRPPLSGSVILNPKDLTDWLAPLDGSSDSSDAREVLDLQLSAASLYNANLSNANLSNANLSNANLSNANLTNSDLTNANLSNANLSNANLSNYTLQAAHLSNANLSNSDLSSANLSNTTLYNANLSNANLSNADLWNANLSNANLSNANLSNAALADIDYTVTNSGNTTQGFDVRLFTTAGTTYAPIQLIVSRPYGKPIANGCSLLEQPDNQLAVNAGIVRPSTELNRQDPLATFTIAPRETVRVTLRTYGTLAEARTLATLIAPVVTPQGDPNRFAYGLIITRLASQETVKVGTDYDVALEAKGGKPDLTWSLEAGQLPPGLRIEAGRLKGIPTDVRAAPYEFTIKVVDTSVPQNQMFKDVSMTVEKGVTTTSLSTSTSSAVYGEAVTLSATVTPPTAPGPVTFRDGTTVLGTATAGSGGVFTLTVPSGSIPPLGVGLHAITASHANLTSWAGSTSESKSVRVKVDTTLTLDTVPAAPVYGSSMALRAKFTSLPPGAPDPTVGVDFAEGATSRGTGYFQPDGALSPPFTTGGGVHYYDLTFLGDDNYKGFSLTGVPVTVSPAGFSSASLSSTASPSYFGTEVVFTARLRSSAGTPGGTVTFFVDGSTSGTTVPVGADTDLFTLDGVAKFRTSTFGVGYHTVRARYSGTADFAPVDLGPVDQVVKGRTSATISSTPNPSRDQEAVTLGCTVTSAAPPAGTVTFLDGATSLGSPALPDPAKGTPTSTTWTLGNVKLGTGSHALTCAFTPSGAFDPATSPAITQLVGPIPTTTAVTASPTSIVYGGKVTLTATVTSAVGTPTGLVTFTSGTRIWKDVAVVAGVATITDSTLDVGSYAFKADYGGDSLFQGSSGTTATNVTVKSLYAFTGFLTPLKTAGTWSLPTYSGTQKLGSAIPVKWQLKDASGAVVSDLGSLKSLLAYPVTCGVLGPPTGSSPLFLYVIPGGATGGSTYRYGSGTFIFNWDTTSGVNPGCFDLVLTLKDGTQQSTIVKLQ